MSESIPAPEVPSVPTASPADEVDTAPAAIAQATEAIDRAAQTANEIAGEIANVNPAAPATAADATAQLAAEPTPIPAASELRRLLAIEVPVIVQLGVRRMSVGEVMRFSVGSIIEFHKAADDELELLANNMPIGKGHAVKVSENFGIKLTRIGPVKETIRKLGMA